MAVTAVVPGRSIDLKDILSGETHHVLERSASSSLQPGLVLLARVVADGDIAVMSGCGPYPLTPADRNRIIDFREQFLRRRGPVDHAHLKESVLDLLAVYQQHVDQMLHPAPPRLTNTDGDPIAPTTLVFELRCGVREAFDRLKVLSLGESDDDLLADATWSDTGDLTRAEVDWSKRGNKMHPDWDNTTLGHLALATGEITVSVNSAKRATKIRRLIDKHLGHDALYLRCTVESVEALIDPARRSRGERRDDDGAGAFTATPEGRAAIEELNRRHWRAWLDEKIPALGKVTPRQAAKSTLGRERLEALLAEFGGARTPAHRT